MTADDIAGMIDHALLHPTLALADLHAGCEIAARCGVATACVKPSMVAEAARRLSGTRTRVSTVVGFPHGGTSPESKLFEIGQACGEGAAEIDAVVNIGWVLGGAWDDVRQELTLLAEESHRHGALLKVIFETGYLPDDSVKVRLCQACEEAGADYVKTSTGFGLVNGVATGATEHDIALMRRACSARVGVKASGGVRDLATLMRLHELGATRIGTSATESILAELAGADSTAASPGGY